MTPALDLLRGVALFALSLVMIGITGYLAWWFDLLSYERRAHAPMVFCGFALSGICLLVVFFIALERQYPR